MFCGCFVITRIWICYKMRKLQDRRFRGGIYADYEEGGVSFSNAAHAKSIDCRLTKSTTLMQWCAMRFPVASTLTRILSPVSIDHRCVLHCYAFMHSPNCHTFALGINGIYSSENSCYVNWQPHEEEMLRKITSTSSTAATPELRRRTVLFPLALILCELVQHAHLLK